LLTFSVEDSFGITSGSASSQWENQNCINTLVTDIGQVLLDSAKQTFGVKLVNTNYSKKKKNPQGG
jgi:hypothetical protein